MRKFNKERQAGQRRNQQARWKGLALILKLCARAEHTVSVEPVVVSEQARDILAHTKNI